MLLKSAFALALLASSAAASGIKIEVAGEGANGTITIDLFEDIAPNHAERISTLAAEGAYDGVVFHRVISGFMAQTGDVVHGREGGNIFLAGTGGSEYGMLKQEFSNTPFDRGVVGMARSSEVDSANSQFFIMFAPGHFLNGNYTVVGQVTEGLDVLDQISRGEPPASPDVMKTVTPTE